MMWYGPVPCMPNLLENKLRFSEAPYRVHYSSIYAKGILGGGFSVIAMWLARTLFGRSLAN
jgi:Na+/H+ antiporter NhaA